MNNKAEDTNSLLEELNKRVINLENTLEDYEKIIDDYESSNLTGSLLQGSQLVAYNTTNYVVHWQILNLDGSLVYETGDITKYDYKVIHLTDTTLVPGSQFQFKAVQVASGSVTYAQNIIYQPQTNTLYFELYLDDKASVFSYIGMLKSYSSPPVVNVSLIYIYNDALVQTHYQLRAADTNTILFTSGEHKSHDSCLLHLNQTNIAPGTVLKLHADVTAGDDSEPYALMKYDPNVSSGADTINFTLKGNAFLTNLYFDSVN